MNKSIYATNPLGITSYLATDIPCGLGYYVDKWLIGKADTTVDAKRISPVIWMYMKWLISALILYMFYLMEDFSYYFFGNKFPDQSRIEFITWRIQRFYEVGAYDQLLFGLIISSILMLVALNIILARYPTPLRFNKSNGLVYYKLKGKIWVTPWSKAKIKLWRFSNTFSGSMVVERAIAVRLFSLNRKGELIERWEPISGIDNLSDSMNEQVLGGDPTLLYWHWLNDYMLNKEVPEPQIGKISIFERLHFRKYQFPKSIDVKAQALHQRLIDENLYMPAIVDTSDCAPVPNDPHFTFLEDFPHMEKPQYQIETAARFAAQIKVSDPYTPSNN